MKRTTLLTFILLMAGLISAGAQDPVLIIDEDFQTWPATEGVVSDPPEECESFGHVPGPDMYDLTYETGGSGQVKLIKYLISPECNTKRVNQGEAAENFTGVTTGFVQLTKVSEETDTIGEMWLPELSNVTEIDFSYSCTSSDRGVRVYTSTDGGETWEGPWTEDGPGVGEIIGSDTKLGEGVFLEINRDNVIIKFTSGVDLDGVSQNSRIHDIKVWGVPGGPETGIQTASRESINAFYQPGNGLVLRGEVIRASVFDLTGRRVAYSNLPGDQVIELFHQPDGAYILHAVDTRNHTYKKKFIKTEQRP